MLIIHIVIAVITLVHALGRLFIQHGNERLIAATLTSLTLGSGVALITTGASVVRVCESLAFYALFLGAVSVVRTKKSATVKIND